MKSKMLSNLDRRLAEILAEAQDEDIVVYDSDRPVAVIRGLLRERDGDDAPFWVEEDRELWEQLRAARQQPTVSMEDAFRD
jgi:predicted kinase